MTAPNVFLVTGRSDRLWRGVLAVAAAVTTLVLCILPAVGDEYDARLDLDAARMPVEIGTAVGVERFDERAIALWGVRNDELDGVEVTVQFFLPIKDEGVTPPGIGRWPRADEVFASPATMRLPGAESFVGRYGELVGSIGVEGLASATERVLYVGVDEAQLDTPTYWSQISGFGLPRNLDSGDHGYLAGVLAQADRSAFARGGLVFVLLPLIVLLVVVARLGGPARDHAIAVAVALGATRRQLWRMLLVAVGRPIVVGAAFGGAVALVVRSVDWTVPVVSYPLTGRPSFSVLASIIVCAVLATASVIATAWIAHARRAGAGTGQKVGPPAQRPSGRPVVALVVVVAATNWAYAFFVATDPELAGLALFVGAATCVGLLGPVTTSILAGMSGFVVAQGARFGSATAILVGREMRALGRPMVHSTVFIGVVAITATFATVLMTMPAQFLVSARGAQALNGDRSVMIATGTEGSWLADAEERLGADVAFLGVGASAAPDDPPSLTLPCSTQEKLGLGCAAQGAPVRLPSTDTLTEVLPLWGLDAADPARSEPLGPGRYVVVSLTDRALDIDQIRSVVRESASPAPKVSLPHEAWVVGGNNSVRHSQWITLAALVAAALAMSTGTSAIAWEAQRLRSRHAVFAYFAGTRARILGAAFGAVGVPLVIGATLGSAVGVVISWTAANSGVLSSDSPGAVLLGILSLTGLTVALSATWVASRAAVWRRPTRENRDLALGR